MTNIIDKNQPRRKGNGNIRALLLAAAVATGAAYVYSGGHMCQYEDSTFCYWDAQVQGNGQGQSFIALWGDQLIYLGD